MGLSEGWAALNVQGPSYVPRWEAGVELHIIRAVTGMDITPETPGEKYLAAIQEFVRLWKYDMMLGAAVSYDILEKKRSSMGHAVWTEQGRDYDDKLYCPFETVEDVLAFDPFEAYGEEPESAIIERFTNHYRAQCAGFPDMVNMTGIYTTLMSGMIAIFGWEKLLEACGTDPDGFGEVVNRYAKWIGRYYTALSKSEARVIYSHDDMVWTEGAFIDPAWYRKYIFPNLERLWAPLVAAGQKIIFFCDGNYTAFLDDIAACGNSAFWFECFTDLEVVCRKFGKTHSIMGNVDVRPLTFGTKADIRAEVERCMAAGKDCPGYWMVCSGHLPSNVPVENALYYNDCYMELRDR